MRIRRNCITDSDYHEQAQLLKDRFLAKGYQDDVLQRTILEVGEMDRNILMADRVANKDKKSNQIKNIMKRRWGILKTDPVLGRFLPEKPEVGLQKGP